MTNSCLHLEPHIPLLKEAHNLVGSGDAGIVVRLQCLSTHLLRSEDAPLCELVTKKLLHRSRVPGRNVGEVDEVRLLLEDLEQLSFVHHLHPGCVDKSAALG